MAINGFTAHPKRKITQGGAPIWGAMTKEGGDLVSSVPANSNKLHLREGR